MNTNIKFLTINTSYNCNSRCKHCRYPGISNNQDYITPELIENCLNGLYDHGPEWIIIGGGEPFLKFYKLIVIIQMIKKILPRVKIHITTSGGWGTDIRMASEMAGTLLEAGVDGISFSVDSFHQEYIPLQHVNMEPDGEVGEGEATGVFTVSVGVGFNSPLNRLHPEKHNTHNKMNKIAGDDLLNIKNTFL